MEAEASLVSGEAPGSGDRASQGTDSRGLSRGGPSRLIPKIK